MLFFASASQIFDALLSEILLVRIYHSPVRVDLSFTFLSENA